VDPRRALFDWYRPRERSYPWRRSKPDPYRVLVSEVMLQQTQAGRVAPVYRAFVRRFPTIRALAAAERAEVIRAWNGLGYNRRAVALSETARIIVRDHGGRLPRDPEQLRLLPGIGPYTSTAVASIAFGVPVPALDTNVRRGVARFALGAEPHEVEPSVLREAAGRLVDRRDPGRWNQALMDLGRELCRPVPRCEPCPLAEGCSYRRSGRRGGRSPRRQPTFAGSVRQLRGRVVTTVASGEGRTLGALMRLLGEPSQRLIPVLRALGADGVVRPGPAALAGNPRGRVRLG
jgi:A/G-specific adenine glycosylase